MKRLLPLIVLVAIVACKGRQRTPTGPVPVESTEAPRPEWVRSRPVSSAYYIGIGLASKARPDVMETAKKNALNDLASEISVTVEGNSLLYTLDRKTRFDESFTSTIRTRTSEQIEGFELMDTWENGTEYWTYYRLSRSEHARLKAERKQRAIANATDLFTRARTSIGGGDLRSAMDSDLRALIAMKSYWGENDVVEIDGKQVPLVNEVYGHLQRRSPLPYASQYFRSVVSWNTGTTSAVKCSSPQPTSWTVGRASSPNCPYALHTRVARAL